MLAPKIHTNLLSNDQIPPHIQFVLSKLHNAGFEGLLVGGCIRDLLLKVEPKDFDVVTDARPNEIKDIFRKSRIVGRRFKIVHVVRDREIVEVSTFRRAENQSVLKQGDIHRNLYGSIDDDFSMRDFTANALYFDPEQEAVLDYVNGIQDIENGTLRCLGDPKERFRDDPGRILRAIRIISKLPLKLEASVQTEINRNKGMLPFVKPARMHTELEKLLLLGHAESSYRMLESYHLTSILFPDSVTDDPLSLAAMNNTDSRVRSKKPVTIGFLLAAIMWREFCNRTQYEPQGRMSIERAKKSATALLNRQKALVSIAPHVREFITNVWTLQVPLERHRPKRVRSLLSHQRFRAAYDLLVLRASVGDADPAKANWWSKLQDLNQKNLTKAIARTRPYVRRRKKKPRSGVTPPIATTT